MILSLIKQIIHNDYWTRCWEAQCVGYTGYSSILDPGRFSAKVRTQVQLKTKVFKFLPFTKGRLFPLLRWVSAICKNLSDIQKSHKCMWKITHWNYSMDSNKKAQNVFIQRNELQISYKYSEIQLKLLGIPIKNFSCLCSKDFMRNTDRDCFVKETS